MIPNGQWWPPPGHAGPGWRVLCSGRERVAEDDPDSDFYAESSDAETVMGYITAYA